MADDHAKSFVSKKAGRKSVAKKGKKEKTPRNQDDGTLAVAEKVLHEARGYYFEAYSSVQTHELMIKDNVRTSAYKRAMELNKHLFQDKIVLDVGCGLGILSLFAASAGARTVIGIDASDIAIYAKKVVERSVFNNIFIIQSKVEEVENLPNNINKVDIIVSEWMGVCLYHESMLSTVLFARDKWLDKDGLLFPDEVHFYLGGFDDSKRQSNGFNRWNAVYGFNLAPMSEFTFNEAHQEIIQVNQVVTNCERIQILHLNTASSDYAFTAEFTLNVKRSCYVNGFLTYFDVIFSQCHKPIKLSTSPFTPPTHWRHTTFYLRDPIVAQADDEISGEFSLNPFRHNFRDLEIKIRGKHIGQVSGKYFDTRFILR